MTEIPKSHPRFESLTIRENLVKGFEDGLVAREGLMAHGRGEAFDYLIGEKTTKGAKKAIKAAAAMLLLAKSPVISVNGNLAALCPKEVTKLSKIVNAKIEVNLFYSSNIRKKRISKKLTEAGAKEVLGTRIKDLVELGGIDSSRRNVDKHGIHSADVVLVPLEDGDRTLALRENGKKVITFDLNPLSRTAQTADISIIDNVTRGMKLLIYECQKLQKKKTKLKKELESYNQQKSLSEALKEMKYHLAKRSKYA